MNNTTRGMLFSIVGAYIIYMGVQMYHNTVSGASTMSMTTTIILMSLMIIAGVGVVIYGIKKMANDMKEQKKNLDESAKESDSDGDKDE